MLIEVILFLLVIGYLNNFFLYGLLKERILKLEKELK